MKPIIKWSGGKSQEIKFFESYIPQDINRYIEPFFGGGAVFFYLEKNKSIINDINFELISLYQIIHNTKQRNLFISHLEHINAIRNDFNTFFDKYNEKEIKSFFTQLQAQEDTLVLNAFISDNKQLNKLVMKSLKDKIKRINQIEIKENVKFGLEELKNHLITSFQSALYFFAREIYNEGFNPDKISLELYIANWYYVREFCYSSMFRFSSSGKFNVPYGGIGYNSKDFESKINYLKNNTDLHLLLENADINNLDFQELFEKYDYFENKDFIFLDPPYDSEFSQYNKEQDFDKNEQVRLRDCLLKVKCKFMVVIKETEFISDLYKDKYFKISKFDKTYLTNMRNRNNKEVQHLIITNY